VSIGIIIIYIRILFLCYTFFIQDHSSTFFSNVIHVLAGDVDGKVWKVIPSIFVINGRILIFCVWGITAKIKKQILPNKHAGKQASQKRMPVLSGYLGEV
jgi:hypothetical protein